MSKLLPGQVAVERLDLWWILLGYCRYAMGRRSTAPSTASEMVHRYAEHLEPRLLAQIAEEIRAERHLGDECDRREWMALAEWIEGRERERSDCPECRCTGWHQGGCSRGGR